MLRHALMVALFRDFQLRVSESLPAQVPKNIDAVVVDGATLRGGGKEIVAGWNLPVVWIDADPSGESSPVDRWVRLNWPVSKESLRLSLAQCLGARPAPLAQAVFGEQAASPVVKAKRKAHKPVEDSPQAGEFIELVDIVEEEALR